MRRVNFKNKKILIIATIGFFFLISGTVANAEETASLSDEIVAPVQMAEQLATEQPTTTPILNQYQVTVNYLGENIFSNTVTPTSTWFIDVNQSIYTNEKITALGALAEASRQGQFPLEIQNYGYGYYVSSVNGHSPIGFDGWVYNVNSQDPGYQGINDYQIQNNDSLQVFYSVWPWKITSDVSTTTVSSTVVFTAYNYTSSTWQIAPSTTVFISGEKYLTDSLGQYSYTPNTTGTISAYIFGTDAWPQNSPGISILVLDAPTNTTSTSSLDPIPNPPTGGQGGTTQTTTTLQTISQIQISDTINKILNYFKTQQSPDGKIIDGTITDWAIMSYGANNQYAEEIKNTTSSLLDYEKKYNIDDPSDMNSCASYPRHVLTLLSAGVSTNDSAIQGLKNKMLTVCYKNNLYGLSGINDDVFGLLALLAVDVNPTEPIIQDIVSTTKSWQLPNGAFSWPDWNDSAQKTAGDDITGAAIDALKYAQTKGVIIDNEIFAKAKNYLKSTQQTDGGWGYGASDIMTTSWALMGINALGEGQNEWFTASGTNPWYPLINQLKTDGYYESAWVPGTVDWFAMKHAVPALAGKSWPIVMPHKIQNFSQGATFTYGSGSNYVPLEISTTTITITTIASTTIPTTTLETTTSTIDTTKPIVPRENNAAPLLIANKPSNVKNIPVIKTKKITTDSTNITSVTISPGTTQDDTVTNIINELPIDTSHKNSAKKVLAVSGGSAAALGIYLGLRLLKNVI